VSLTKKHAEGILLAVLLLGLAAGYLSYSGQRSRRSSALTASGAYLRISAMDIIRMVDRWEKTQGTKYEPGGRNIFTMGIASAGTRRKPITPSPVRYYGPFEQKPVLPMVFFGYGAVPIGGQLQGFLKDKDGESVHIVSEGDLVLNHFRILHIGNERLDFEDTATGQKGSLNLEMAQTSS
jgi:hypothetical protein